MFRAFINEAEVIKAVAKVIFDKPKNEGDIRLRPGNPEYPEQCWIELHHVNAIGFEEVRRLQRPLHRRNMYSIGIYAAVDRNTGLSFIKICAHTPEMWPKYFKGSEENETANH